MQIQRTDAFDGQRQPKEEGSARWSGSMQGVLIKIKDTIPFNFRHLSLLQHADVKKYAWHMLEGDFSYIENSKNESVAIRPGVLSGSALEQIMGMDYGINRLVLRAFSLAGRAGGGNNGGGKTDHVCFLVLVVLDYRHIEVYCRDEAFVRRTAEACRRDPDVELVEIASADAEGNTGFFVW